MDTQPPQGFSTDLEEKVADLQADLTEIKQLLQKLVKDIDDKFPLTDQSNHRYYYERGLDNQGKNEEEGSPILSPGRKQVGKPKQLPYVEEGDQAICTRCGHTWIPFVRRPKQCPACRQTWYKPKAWTRTKSLIR